MENNSLFTEFAERFASASLTSLVESFNAQVGNRGWSSARSAHDQALMEELVKRGVDVSAVCDGQSISFAHTVVIKDNRLTAAE